MLATKLDMFLSKSGWLWGFLSTFGHQMMSLKMVEEISINLEWYPFNSYYRFSEGKTICERWIHLANGHRSGALMLSLSLSWKNWANSRIACDSIWYTAGTILTTKSDIMTFVTFYFFMAMNPSWPSAVEHDDVIKWKHFLCDWPFVRGIHRSPVTRSFDVSLICAWINGWEKMVRLVIWDAIVPIMTSL